jgi:micrococcal nuclease
LDRRLLAVLAVAAICTSTVGLLWLSTGSPEQTGLAQTSEKIERTAVVDHVIDGDTICLEGGEKVRLVGVDAEETKLNAHARSWHPELQSMNSAQYQQTEYYQKAMAAKDYVTQLCPSGTQIGLDVDDLTLEDKYSRTLSIVYVKENGDWMNLNAELLHMGLVVVLYIPPSEFNPYAWAS